VNISWKEATVHSSIARCWTAKRLIGVTGENLKSWRFFANERGSSSNLTDRLRLTIEKKLVKYKTIANRLGFSLVIAIHPDCFGCAGVVDVLDAVTEGDLFAKFSELSGILLFSETVFQSGVQNYRFQYLNR
jgi:hypothetical protein